MAVNATAVYNTTSGQVCMLVVDAADLTDPSFNPPDCVQIPLDIEEYNQLQSNEELYTWIAAKVAELQT